MAVGPVQLIVLGFDQPEFHAVSVPVASFPISALRVGAPVRAPPRTSRTSRTHRTAWLSQIGLPCEVEMGAAGIEPATSRV